MPSLQLVSCKAANPPSPALLLPSASATAPSPLRSMHAMCRSLHLFSQPPPPSFLPFILSYRCTAHRCRAYTCQACGPYLSSAQHLIPACRSTLPSARPCTLSPSPDRHVPQCLYHSTPRPYLSPGRALVGLPCERALTTQYATCGCHSNVLPTFFLPPLRTPGQRDAARRHTTFTPYPTPAA